MQATEDAAVPILCAVLRVAYSVGYRRCSSSYTVCSMRVAYSVGYRRCSPTLTGQAKPSTTRNPKLPMTPMAQTEIPSYFPKLLHMQHWPTQPTRRILTEQLATKTQARPIRSFLQPCASTIFFLCRRARKGYRNPEGMGPLRMKWDASCPIRNKHKTGNKKPTTHQKAPTMTASVKICTRAH